MGKGTFLITHARKYPNRNFIGVEKYASVLYKLIGKFKPTKEELENNNRSRSAILRVIERI